MVSKYRINKVFASPNNWDKFKLLMWKNFLIHWRHKVRLFIEILVPLSFTILIVFLRYSVEPKFVKNATIFDSIDIDSDVRFYG